MTLLLALIFLLSGAAALVFETLWFRQAGLAFGNGVWASSIVLSSFMGGLALGNGLAARFGDRVRRPLLVYAGLELAIAAAGLAIVLLLPGLGRAVASLLGAVREAPWALNSLRFGLAFALLLLPATAMGATLPLLVRAMHARVGGFGEALGWLYGVNTLGAVAGAVAAEAWLVGALGVRGSAALAAGLDVAAALGALGVSRRLGRLPDATSAAPALDSAGGSRLRAVSIGAAAFLAGAAFLALEVVWFRLLQLFVAPSPLAFALMLGSVLAGIGLGGLVAAAWARRDPACDRFAPGLAAAVGLAVVGSFAGFDEALALLRADYLLRARDVVWASTALVLAPSFLSGALFPLVGAALRREMRLDSRSAGVLTLANTLGAALGALLAGFVLLPRVGSEASIFALGACYLLVTLALFAGRSRALPRRSRLLARAACAGLGGALAIALFAFPFGAMREHHLAAVVERYRTSGAPWEPVLIREGRLETLFLFENEFLGRPLHHRLVTDGYSMSGTNYQGQRYMKLFAYWPAAFHPRLERALLISYGVGNTAAALTQIESLERIDVVDISRDILALSPRIHTAPGADPLDDPRVRVHVEDGRHFLQTTPERYDLITGEPPPPKVSGVVNLYTAEYFGLLRSRLAPGGIATYWLPVHNLRPSDGRAIAAAFCAAFDDCSLWAGSGWDWMLVGSRDGIRKPDAGHFGALWRRAEARRSLERAGLERPAQLGTLFLADAENLRAWFADTPPVTDDFPKRISDAPARPPLDRPAFEPLMRARDAAQRFAASDWIAQVYPDGLRDETLRLFEFQALVNEHLLEEAPPRDPALRLRRLHRVLQESDLVELPRWLLGVPGDHLDRLSAALDEPRAGERYAHLLGRAALAERRYAEAARHFARARRERARSLDLFALRVYALGRAGDREAALGQACRALVRPGSARAERDLFQALAEVLGSEGAVERCRTPLAGGAVW